MTDNVAESSRYRLSPGLVRYATDVAYIFHGGAAVEAFTGPGAVDVLPELCDLLDGTRTVAQIAAILRVPQADALSGIELLAGRDLARSTTAVEANRPAAASMTASAYLDRTLGFTGRASTTEEVFEKWHDAAVLLVGNGPLRGLVDAELTRAGIAVAEYAPDVLADLRPNLNTRWAANIVVEILDNSPGAQFTAVASALEVGLPWICAGATNVGGFVGPILYPSMSCRCELPKACSPDRGSPSRAVTELIASIISGEVVNGLGGGAAVATLNRRIELTFAPNQAPKFINRLLTRDLDCPYCGNNAGSGDGPTSDVAQLSWDYEQAIEINPPAFYAPSIPARAFKVVKLDRRPRRLPTCPRIPVEALPSNSRLRSTASFLARTVGTRTSLDALPSRVIPTAGDLGSPQAFVVSSSEISTLGTHCAWYDPVSDQLVATGKVAQKDVAVCLAEMLGVPWGELVVWVADLAAVAEKYGDFALRLVHLDAGVVFSQAVIAAHATGLKPQFLTRWDATVLSRLLDLDLAREVVTGVMVLGADPEGTGHER